jgi:trimeric autotransporter adhesin
MANPFYANQPDYIVQLNNLWAMAAGGPEYAPQTPNFIFCGPATGSTAGTPAFRAFVPADQGGLLGSGSLSLAANLTTTGAYTVTLAATAATNVTLPTSGTLLSTTSAVGTFPTLNQNTTGSAGSVPYTGLTGTVPIWNQNTTGNAANVTGVVAGANGGTGVANTGHTITVGGNLAFSGVYTYTLTATGNTAVTLPVSGTLLSTASTAASFPTLNQSTTGTAAVANALASATTIVSMSGATAPTVGQAIVATSATTATWQTLTSTGTVTSVALSLPALFTVTGSPITTNGTLGATFASQGANLFLASPNGSAGAPTMRAIAVADVPTLNQNTTGSAASVPYSGLTGTVPTWNQNTTGNAANVTGVVAATNGGTGVNNGASTLTLGASHTTTGAGASTLAFPGVAATYTFPTTTATLARTDAAQTFTGIQTFADGGTWSSTGISDPTVLATNSAGVGTLDSNTALNVNKVSTGSGVFNFGVQVTQTGISTGTSGVYAMYSQGASAAAAYTVSEITGLFAASHTKGAGSTVASAAGIILADQTVGASNYGIESRVSFGTNKWNIYAGGTANNYLAGNTGIATSASSSSTLSVGAPINAAATVQYGILCQPTSTSAATSSVIAGAFYAFTSAASYTSGNAIGVYIAPATAGAGSTITNGYGLQIQDQTAATNNYGLWSGVSSGTNKWNIYASGTALNYFNGRTLIGTTTDDGTDALQVNGTIKTTGITTSGDILCSAPSLNIGDGSNSAYVNAYAGNSAQLLLYGNTYYNGTANAYSSTGYSGIGQFSKTTGSWTFQTFASGTSGALPAAAAALVLSQTSLQVPNGTAAVPGNTFIGAGNTGLYYLSPGIGFSVIGSSVAQITGTGINSTAIGQTAAAAGTFTTTKFTTLGDSGGHTIFSSTAPTIASGFGTSPSIIANNTAAFQVTVGTSPAGTGVLTLPAAPNGWVVDATDVSTPGVVVVQTATSTTSATLTAYLRTTGATTNFTAADKILCQATAF